MVKPDVKHNYYQDLDLPTTATVEDVRKAYRKLALQYHPDRNAGKEEEVVPRFQAIQAANEILSDPTTKAKYDADRRKTGGVYPSFKSSGPTPGNPYTARSDFPPPPRRTQPGTWQRTPSNQPGTPGPTPPSGADRFTNFPRPAGPAPQKNPAADRTQQFRAWQSMNNPERPRYPAQPPQPPPRNPQPPPTDPKSPRPGAAPTSNRPRMPPGTFPKMPTEEQIRAGMRHGKATTPAAEDAAQRQSAWQAFQKSNGGQPGMAKNWQGRPPATPKRTGGFDPNAPGSDERPAPASSHYVHRHKSEDFTAGGFPPPPPGPPPSNPTTPLSPGPPPRNHNIPYVDANRTSTPYTRSGGGEKTAFSSDGLRRSVSTRDTTKLPAGGINGHSRARSVDPAVRQEQAARAKMNGSRGKTKFIPGMYSDSSSASTSSSGEDQEFTKTPEEFDSNIDGNAPAGNSAPTNRPIKKPTPPSRFFKGSTTPFPPPPGPDGAAHTDTEPMEEREKSQNMYESPFVVKPHPTPSSFQRQTWVSNAFGARSAAGGGVTIPQWAIPSSVFPPAKKKICRDPSDDERLARELFQSTMRSVYGDVDQFDFREAVDIIRSGHSLGNRICDETLCNILSDYPSVGDFENKHADQGVHSFSFPLDHDTFKSTPAKSRSEEGINTTFSPEGWNGKFTGSGDYFAADGGRRPSPGRRNPSHRNGRAATSDSASSSHRNSPIPPSIDATFSKDTWEQTFKDNSWTMPPPPPNPPASKPSSRRNSRFSAKTNGPAVGTAAHPHVVDEDDDVVEVDRNGHPVNGTVPVDVDGDAMDIDTPPRPEASTTMNQGKEPRLYSVPPSAWRQSQGHPPQTHHLRHTSSASRRAERQSADSNLKVNLDDLSQTEPFAATNEGLRNLADLSSTLPFNSKAAPHPPTHPLKPQKLELPKIPRVPEPPIKLTKAHWHDHTQRFSSYLLAWHIFNKTMLDHFLKREQEVEVLRHSGTDWLTASGDPVVGPGGFGGYAKALKEDERVREAWNLGCDQHLEAVKSFEQLRERVRHLASGGSLPEA